MSLVEKVEALLKEDKTDAKKSEALKRAEKLADKYESVRPQTFSVPMERFYGFPAFETEKNA